MRDLLYAFRGFLATPVVSIVAVLSLGLGIGANTAIFSLLDGLVLRPIPVRAPERLARLLSADTEATTSWTYPIWEQIRDRREVADGVAAWSVDRFNLAPAGQTDFAEALWVSGEFFAVLGVPPMLGRTFSAADDRRANAGGSPTAVISYRFWQRRFAGAADVVGRSLQIDRVAYTIAGVTPPEFLGPEIGRAFDIAVPLATEPLIRGAESALDRKSYWWLSVMFRLRDGQSLEQLRGALRGIQPQIRDATMPEHYRPQDRASYLAEPFGLTPGATGESMLRERYQRPLAALMVLVALVLLVACANIANLLIARAAARRRELSVRVALGASRARLARQLFAESGLLAVAGAALGLTLASLLTRVLLAQLSTQVRTVVIDVGIDWRVALFTSVVTIATALLFGIAPALLATRAQPVDAIKAQDRTVTGERRWSLGNALVVVQVALSIVLVVGAGLFVRSFAGLARVHLGFDSDRLLVATVSADHAAVAPPDRAAFYQRLADTVRGTPGVAAAAVSEVTPVGSGTWDAPVDLPHAPALSERERTVLINAVGPAFFATYGTRLLSGGEIDPRDTAGAPPVVLVNDAFARKFFQHRSPLGQHIVTAQGTTAKRPVEIVGVVETAKYRSLREAEQPTIYLALAQSAGARPMRPSIILTVRAAAGSPALITRSVAASLAAVNPNLSFTFRPMDDQVGASRSQERLVALLSGFFGALALLLAGLGLYGITACGVTRRSAEIGIRLALGATPRQIAAIVLGRVATLVGAGAVLGIAISWWSARYAAALVFGLPARDATTLAAAVVVLGTVGLIAGTVPARRAAAIDPAAVLRR
jgi:predicted permease